MIFGDAIFLEVTYKMLVKDGWTSHMRSGSHGQAEQDFASGDSDYSAQCSLCASFVPCLLVQWL